MCREARRIQAERLLHPRLPGVVLRKPVAGRPQVAPTTSGGDPMSIEGCRGNLRSPSIYFAAAPEPAATTASTCTEAPRLLLENLRRRSRIDYTRKSLTKRRSR